MGLHTVGGSGSILGIETSYDGKRHDVDVHHKAPGSELSRENALETHTTK